MAEIVPFRALRYDPRVVPDLRQVVAPPYDVISSAAQERYHTRHPHNMVRLILPQGDATDTPSANRYTRAGETLAAWRRDRILQRDAVPAIYLYEQEFSIGSADRLQRRGLLALVRLHEYEDGVIFPHERTFPRYKDDRLQLMRACPANLEAILGFYPGPSPVVAALCDRYGATNPTVHVVDEDGVGHRVWPVQAPPEVEAIQAELRDQPVVIADGHHRYETALNFRNERRALAPGAGAASRRLEEFVLINLVAADDPGLVILPTHRIIRRRPACGGNALRRTLARHFRIESFSLDAANPLPSLRTALADLDRRRGAGIACAVCVGPSEVLVLELTDPATPQALLKEGRAPAFANLDVAVVHRLLVEDILGIPLDSQTGDNIQYTRDESEALTTVATGDACVAIFLNPPSVEQVRAVAMAGDRMSQKSTYFFPKVLGGLVINPLDAGEEIPS